MIDIKFIRNNPELVKEAVRNKNEASRLNPKTPTVASDIRTILD